jgi:hypothetical protein
MYISDGALRESRPCGLWIIPALFWIIINFFGLFFQTMTPCYYCKNKKRKVNTLN